MFFMYAVFKVQLTSERKITDKCWKLASISLYLIFYARHVSVVTEQALLVRFGCIADVFLNIRVEMKRFELSTPCLQGRCSPN